MDKITLGTRNVSIEFPGVKALSNVDFEIHTGMIHAVMGANGAGSPSGCRQASGEHQPYCRRGNFCLVGDIFLRCGDRRRRRMESGT